MARSRNRASSLAEQRDEADLRAELANNATARFDDGSATALRSADHPSPREGRRAPPHRRATLRSSLRQKSRAVAQRGCISKVDQQLFPHAGPEIAREIAGPSGSVFLDLEVRSIPRTVANGRRARVEAVACACE